MTAAAVFAAVFAALYAAHMVGDHWVQTGGQAAGKGARTAAGRRACTAHVLTLVFTKYVFLAVTAVVLNLHLSGLAVLAGLTVDAVSHWWADRRYTFAALAALAARLGKAGFYALGQPRAGRDDNPSLGTGAYALDQSWHICWLFVAALLVAGLGRIGGVA